jgi:hypothetical protein
MHSLKEYLPTVFAKKVDKDLEKAIIDHWKTFVGMNEINAR